MSQKISFEIAAAVSGLQHIKSTASATERLTASIERQRAQMSGVNRQLNDVASYENTKQRISRLGDQLEKTRSKYKSLGAELEQQKEKNAVFRTETHATANQIKQLERQIKSASSDGLQPLQAQLEAAKSKFSSLSSELSKGKQSFNELKVAQNKCEKAAADLTSKKAAQVQRARTLRSELSKAGLSTKDLASEQAKLAARAEKTAASIAKQNAKLKEMQTIHARIDARKAALGETGGQAANLALAAAPVAGSIFTAMKNETSFASVKKVVDMSAEEAAALRSWSLNLSASKLGGGMSANDINAMLAAGGQTGIKDLAELKQFVIDSAMMGTAFDMEAGTAGETLAVFKASMGLSQKTAMSLAGLINHLSNNSNAKAPDIAEVMAREGATAKTGGFTINQAAALSAALLSNGMAPERAATAVKNISGYLTKGDSATKAQKTAYNKIGLDATEIAASMQVDAAGTLIEVLDAIKDAPLEEQSALMSKIFGDEAKGAVAALAENTKNLTSALKLAADGEKVHLDSLQNEFNSKISTSENGWKTFINSISRLSIIFGTALLPAFNAILAPLSAGINFLSDFAQANQEVTQAVGLVIAGFIGLKGVMLAGKAASLLFGNSMDKGRLFRARLNKQTDEGGDIANRTASAWERLNRAVNSADPRSGAVDGGANGRRRSRGAVNKLKAAALKASNASILKPLALGVVGAEAVQAITNGDNAKAGASVGDIGGSLAGGAAGAALGTMILPGIGTAIGGVLGGVLGSFAGSELGGWLGKKFGSTDETANSNALNANSVTEPATTKTPLSATVLISNSDNWYGRKLDSPEVIAAKIAEIELKKAEAASQSPVNFTAQITVNPSQGSDEKSIAQAVAELMAKQMSELLGGNTVSTRLATAGIDRD